VAVFADVRRVLRDDGTAWLNLGDSYAATTKGSGGHNPKQDSNAGSWMQDRKWAIPPGLKPKDLCGIPWRVAFALQADGWYLRQDIIWSKPNPMPESVRDRCTKAHEYIFLLSKSERYYYDAAGCPKGGTVLDPFGGAGTTGLVADRLGRNAILIELNPEYAAMAERRIKNDAGMFADVAAE
jgi:DNA modification methylase